MTKIQIALGSNGWELDVNGVRQPIHRVALTVDLGEALDAPEPIPEQETTDPFPIEDVVMPEPEPEPEPEPLPPVVQPPSGSLADIGATMEPGEFRVVSEAPFSFSGDNCSGGRIELFGWTPRWGYDPETQSFWCLGMRDASEKALVWFDSDMQWHRRRVPLDNCRTDRRPFGRLTLVDGHLYWPSSNPHDALGLSGRRSQGALFRAPIEPFLSGEIGDWNPETNGGESLESWGWEQFSPGQNISNMNTAGDFAVEYFPDVGGWIFQGRQSSSPATRDVVTQEGHIPGYEEHSWYSRMQVWRPGDERWTTFDRIYGGQYQGCTVYNPFKKACLNYGGTEFGSRPEGEEPSREWTLVIEQDGDPVARKLGRMLIDDVEPDFNPTTRYCAMGHNPLNGDWLLFRRSAGDAWSRKMWSSKDGKNWTEYEDFSETLAEYFGVSYVSMTPIPGSDLILFISQTGRATLHKVKS